MGLSSMRAAIEFGRVLRQLMNIVCRFMQSSYYDVKCDAEVTRFMGITDRGSFFAEQVLDKPGERREKYGAFKEHVISAIESGMPPGRVSLG